jgi:hypothetical protein
VIGAHLGCVSLSFMVGEEWREEGWWGTYSNFTPSGRESPTLRGAIVVKWC